MKKSKIVSIIVAILCLLGAFMIAVTADQISLDSPASLPSDI